MRFQSPSQRDQAARFTPHGTAESADLLYSGWELNRYLSDNINQG